MYLQEFENIYSNKYIGQTKLDKDIWYGVYLVMKHRQVFKAYTQQRDLDLAIDIVRQNKLS